MTFTSLHGHTSPKQDRTVASSGLQPAGEAGSGGRADQGEQEVWGCQVQSHWRKYCMTQNVYSNGIGHSVLREALTM